MSCRNFQLAKKATTRQGKPIGILMCGVLALCCLLKQNSLTPNIHFTDGESNVVLTQGITTVLFGIHIKPGIIP
jgi:hypothetical protein